MLTGWKDSTSSGRNPLSGFPSLWNAVLYGAELAIQIVGLLREERLLNNDASYRDYAQRVPYRLLPLVFCRLPRISVGLILAQFSMRPVL